MWAAYQNIPGLPQAYQHFTVNHSQNFVDPVSNACTNHIEVSYLTHILQESYKSLKDKCHYPCLLLLQCYWKNAKSKIKRMNGVDSDQLTSYLKEYMVVFKLDYFLIEILFNS